MSFRYKDMSCPWGNARRTRNNSELGRTANPDVSSGTLKEEIKILGLVAAHGLPSLLACLHRNSTDRLLVHMLGFAA